MEHVRYAARMVLVPTLVAGLLGAAVYAGLVGAPWNTTAPDAEIIQTGLDLE